MRRSCSILFAGLAAVAFAACGDDGGDAESDSDGSTGSGSTTAETSGETDTGDLYPGMVFVPNDGPFGRGCNTTLAESCNPWTLPALEVTLDPYWIDATEVTRAAYQECVGAGACEPADAGCTSSAADVGPDGPMVCVSLEQAQAYCAFAGKRLPTEAEWEKAARGTDGRAFPWGNDAPDCLRVQTSECGSAPVVVGSLEQGASPYGALDMLGNVAEWTGDRLGPRYYDLGPAENPPGNGHVLERAIRGGSFAEAANTDDFNVWERTLATEPFAPTLGFRCALPEAGLPTCGDGQRQPSEVCDDGNAIGGDGCEADCQASGRAEYQAHAETVVDMSALRALGPSTWASFGQGPDGKPQVLVWSDDGTPPRAWSPPTPMARPEDEYRRGRAIDAVTLESGEVAVLTQWEVVVAGSTYEATVQVFEAPATDGDSFAGAAAPVWEWSTADTFATSGLGAAIAPADGGTVAVAVSGSGFTQDNGMGWRTIRGTLFHLAPGEFDLVADSDPLYGQTVRGIARTPEGGVVTVGPFNNVADDVGDFIEAGQGYWVAKSSPQGSLQWGGEVATGVGLFVGPVAHEPEVLVDDDGSIYVAARLPGTVFENATSFVVDRFSPTGEPIARTVIEDPTPMDVSGGTAIALALLGAGRVLVGGDMSDAFAVVAAIDPAGGEPIWISYPSLEPARLNAFAVDPDGRVAWVGVNGAFGTLAAVGP